MTTSRIPVTIVNHVSLEMPASADTLWRLIVDQYVGATKFTEGPHTIEPIDHPAASLGGYRMRLEQDGVVVDDRVCIVTERDEEARRLSMFADYLAVPGGLQVFATYQAHPANGCALYTIDCHTRMALEAPDEGGRQEVAGLIGQMTATFEAPLKAYLASVKGALEATGR